MTATLLTPWPAAPDVPSDALLNRIQGAGPRYTSYPTADRFDERFGPAELSALLNARRRAAEAGDRSPLSLYVHVPFCESVCYYCACNKVVTKHHSKAREYLEALALETALVTDQLGPQRSVSQLHLGGGSPTFLSDAEIAGLMASIRRFFHLREDAEISIEVDPRTVTTARLAHLHAQGFNRISFGVQDLDPLVQRAIHREQSFDSIRGLVADARRLGFESLNADLIYGLPRQTAAGFASTIAQVSSLGLDRIALYAYAHLPARFKPQRRIAANELPDVSQRVAMLAIAMRGFLGAGYEYVGMDHFALPGDPLARARRDGRLQRNFQGYSTQPDCDLVGLGVSAIGRIGTSHYQNARTLDDYYRALDEGRPPVARGLTPDRDDLVRRDIIMALMCQGRVEFDALEGRHGVRIREAFAPELARLEAMAADGTVRVEARAVQVTPSGWYVVRAIAKVFDRHLQDAEAGERFSRVV